MAVLRQSLLPRRITQLYTDTKRSYEHMIQNNVMHTSQTIVHTKLRIQKDRLIAWGLEWEDSNTTTDIDDSLDRAGISDLVASIMSSIQDLLQRADDIHPQPTISLPGAFPNEKPGRLPTPKWTGQDLADLNEIVKYLTTSIDTLCDLSRSRQALNGPRKVEMSASERPKQSSSRKDPAAHKSTTLIHITRIVEDLFQIPDNDTTAAPASSSPPSYESVAAGSEDRVLAYMRTANESVDKSRRFSMPVLLEYVPVIDVVSTGQHQPPAQRYDDLMQVEPTVLAGLGPTYLGSLKLLGWVEDSRRGRNALVYVIPLLRLDNQPDPPRITKSLTLLSFLHHGADSDSTNMPSLEDRFRLAFNLTSSLLHLHAKGLLHRNINSRNVVFFTNDDMENTGDSKPWKNGMIRRPFLTSFDQCSEDVYGHIEEPFISNIYRHPQSERGQRSLFKPSYDIYSLGLLLLEIGLWMPISKLWKTRYTRANFKSRLQTIYARKLAGKCGNKYLGVVEFCMKAGDQDHQSHSGKADSFKTPFTASQNNMYWKAFKVLEKCCMIDDDADESAEPIDNIPSVKVENVERTPSAGFQTIIGKSDSQSVEALSPGIADSKTQAEEPTQRAVKPKCICKVWSHDIPAAFATHWQQTLEPKLNRMFSKIIDRWESYSIELLMAGETAELARPTIYMVCASVEKARKVLQYVNQDQGLFDIKVSRGSILRSKAGKNRKKRGKGKRGSCIVPPVPDSQNQDQPKRFSHYQERPNCGASIGAYMDEQHLPPVSLGGTVLVNGEPYGMSVHHMLENDDIDYGLDDFGTLEKSMGPKGMNSRQFEDDSEHEPRRDYLPEALYPFEISDNDDDDEGYRSDDLSDFDPSQWDVPEVPDLDDVDMGDTPGIEPGQGDNLLVTQPAIDDVDEGFFPNDDDIDEDHLASHTLGYIHASSGIRRTNRGPISHEIDWALIKLRPHRSHSNPSNVITNGQLHCRTSTPSGVVRATSLGGLKVHALGRTSGLQTGTILPSMVIIKMPGRISHSQSWQVAGGNFGMGGDSGAWVIDNATGGVCAHVLAWSPRSNTAYVAPMEVLLEDMAMTLGVEVMLPGQETEVEEPTACNLVDATAGLTISHPETTQDDTPKLSEAESHPPSHPPPSTSREPTLSPPIATSPPPPATPTPSSFPAPPKPCSLDSKRKSGSEILMEKGEEGFRARCTRMSIG
ncbi:MAG: hypothetical protein Q9182_004159 [Xanthomendoza sp. 2 TL-2023]